MTREDEQTGLAWLADNRERVLQLARGACRGHLELVDELFDEAVDRVGQISACFIEGVGDRERHMLSNLRWYFWKWMNKNAGRVARNEELDDQAHFYDGLVNSIADREERQAVKDLVASLPEYERTLIVLYYVEGLTTRQLGEMLGCNKGTVSAHLADALALARERAGV